MGARFPGRWRGRTPGLRPRLGAVPRRDLEEITSLSGLGLAAPRVGPGAPAPSPGGSPRGRAGGRVPGVLMVRSSSRGHLRGRDGSVRPLLPSPPPSLQLLGPLSRLQCPPLTRLPPPIQSPRAREREPPAAGARRYRRPSRVSGRGPGRALPRTPESPLGPRPALPPPGENRFPPPRFALRARRPRDLELPPDWTSLAPLAPNWGCDPGNSGRRRRGDRRDQRVLGRTRRCQACCAPLHLVSVPFPGKPGRRTCAITRDAVE